MGKAARWAVRLIGPLLLIYFLYQANPAKLFESMRGMTLWPMFVSLALFPVFILVKSWRWQLVMRELGLSTPPLRFIVALYTIGLYTGGITPGQSGDFIKGWYLRDRGLPLAPVLFSILLDRLFDFAVMALLALLGLITLADIFTPDLRAPLRIITPIFAAAIFIMTPLLMARPPREFLLNIGAKLVPERFRSIIERIRDQFAPLNLRPGPLTGLLAASVLSAVSTLFRVGILYLMLPLEAIPITAIIGTTAMIAILQALPISFAGVGVRDAVLIALFNYYGYTTEQALLISVQFLIINIEHILIGFLVSLRYPLTKTEGAEPVASGQ
jgi:uncharacterized protein (TIRG00374 family)